MASKKRHAQPSNKPGPAKRSKTARTHLLDLPDDALGIIYGFSQPRKALRHTCTQFYRSPSVNSQLCSLELSSRWGLEPLPVTGFVRKIAAFPRPATLRILSFRYHTDEVVQFFVQCDQDSSVRAVLNNMEELKFNYVCCLKEAATFIPRLFPKLRSLDLGFSHYGSFKDVMMPQLSILQHLESLKLSVYANNSCEVVQCIATLQGLQSLHIEGHKAPEHGAGISGLLLLRNLKELSLSNGNAIGLPDLLGSPFSPGLPLRHLHLDDVVLPSGMHFASHTLRTISVGRVSLTFPALEAHDLPNLERFAFYGIDFSAGSSVGSGELLSKVRGLVGWLGKIPFIACEDKHIDNDNFALIGMPGWPASLFTALLVELLPLAPAMPGIECATMIDWDLDNEGVSALGELFASSVRPFHLRGRGMHFSDGTGLLQLLRALPHLDNVSYYDSMPPKDLIAALLDAHLASRHVYFEYGTSDENLEAFSVIEDQWCAIRTIMSRPMHAELCCLG